MMNLTRRDFVNSLSAATAVTGVGAGRGHAQRVRSADDPLGVRADFPVVEDVTYLDGAYITPSPLPAVRAAQAFAEGKATDPVSLGRMLEEGDEVRRLFARLVGANEPEVGLLFSTSDGENMVARALDLGPDDNVVIDDLHYETTFLLYQQLLERRGVEVRVVPSSGGAVPAEAFARHVDQRTRLVSVAWVSHQNGYHHDLRPLAELAHAHGAYLYADAIQGVGMLEMDVRAAGVDFLTAGTYKWLLGGYGVAPFFVRAELLDLVTPDRVGSLGIADDLGGHRYRIYDDARKYGYATMAFGAVFQLRAALDYLLAVDVSRVERHTVDLAHRLHRGLSDQGFDVWTPTGNRSAIVTFAHGREVERVRESLAHARIRLSFKDEGARLRVGVALFNNAEEIDRLLDVTGEWA